MAIAVGSVSNTPTLATRTNTTIIAPSSIANGDFLLSVLHVGDGSSVPALSVGLPSGFVAASGSPSAIDNPDPYTVAIHVAGKVASGESGNYTFTHASADTEGFMFRLTGVDTTTPFDVVAVTANSGTSPAGAARTTTTYQSITPITNGCFLLYAESTWDGPGSGTVSAGTPTISVRRSGTISWIGDGTQTTAGATGARTRTNGNANQPYVRWSSIVVAIRPATGSSGTSVATSGSIKALGKVGVSTRTANVRSAAAAGHGSILGNNGFAFASNSQAAIALAGGVSVDGNPVLARASDNKSVSAAAGHIGVVGDTAEATATVHRAAFAIAGSCTDSGAIGLASASDRQDAFASPGAISAIGSQILAAIDISARATAGVISVTPAAGTATLDNLAVATPGLTSISGSLPVAVASDHKRATAASGSASIIGSIGVAASDSIALASVGQVRVVGATPHAVATAVIIAQAIAGTVSDSTSVGIAAVTTGIGAGPTTLDPASIVNFTGTGTLSNGNLTFSSTGVSYCVTKRTAKDKQTFEGVGIFSVRNSVNGNGFWFDWNGSNWIAGDAVGNIIATGPSTPAPVANGVFTVDLDVPNKTASMRYNGATVFTNIDVSGVGLTAWRVQANASSGGFTTSVRFSSLTYPPLSGFVEWDTTDSAAAVAGSVSVTGAVAFTSAHVSALAASAHVADVGQVAFTFASDRKEAIAEAGSISVEGGTPTARASDHKSSVAISGGVSVSGAVPYAEATGGKSAHAVAGSVATVGSEGAAQATDHKETLASTGSCSLIGNVGLATNDKIVIASAGHIRAEGQGGFSVASDHQEAAAVAGNLSVAGSQPTANVTEHKFALAPAGSIAIVGAIPDATAGRRAITYAGAISIIGAQPTAVASRHVRALAITGRVALVGRRSRAFSLMSVLSREQTAIVPAENRTAIVMEERRTAVVPAKERPSQAAPERRTSVA